MDASRIARIAVFAGVVAVMGTTPAVSVPGIAVPITLQTLGVMLAGLMLSPLEAFLAMALFVGMVATGLPLLPGGRGGLAVFTGPSAGFLLGFAPAAAAIAALAPVARRATHGRSSAWTTAGYFASAVLGGIVVLYAVGVPVGAWNTGTSPGTFLRGSMVFLPGDLLKAAGAAAVAVSVFRAAPFLRPQVAR